MNLLDLFLFSMANLRRNKLRTLLTIAGVVVGIAAIVFLVSLGFGVQDLVKSSIGSMKDLTQVKVDPDPKSGVKIDDEIITKLKKLDGVKWVSPSYYLSAQMLINGQKIDLTLYALNPKYLNEIDVKADVGKVPSGPNADEIIVSRSALKVFDLIKEAKSIVGKQAVLRIFIKDKNGNMVLKIKDKKQIQSVQIVGVSKGVKEAAAYIPINKLKSLDIPAYDQALIKSTKPGDTVKELKTKITKMGFKVGITEDILSAVDRYFKVAQIILALFGMIALFVASIGIFNTMTISLLERTHEIGVMKAIGATNKDVRRMFILEAAQIGFWGGIFGLIIGWMCGLFVNYLVNMLAHKFKGQASDIFSIPWQFAAIAVFFALLVSLLAGVYPARRAGKLNPLEAIRYE